LTGVVLLAHCQLPFQTPGGGLDLLIDEFAVGQAQTSG
jgi:hypothetical protein